MASKDDRQLSQLRLYSSITPSNTLPLTSASENPEAEVDADDSGKEEYDEEAAEEGGEADDAAFLVLTY